MTHHTPTGTFDTTFLRHFPDRFVLPHYDGRSVANLPATIGGILGMVDGWASPALNPELTASLPADTERVVLLLVDGLPWWRFQQQLVQQDAGFHQLFAQYGLVCEPITSVAPSTTSVATTVLLGNGACAAETGMLGYQYLLPQQGTVANMLYWYPAGRGKGRYGELTEWGLKPEDFLPTPSIAQQLTRASIPMRVIMPALYSESPLSRMQMRGAQVEGYLNSTDMFLKLKNWLGESAGTRACAYVYYADFDSLSHRDSPEADFWSELWQGFIWQLRRFMESLSAKASSKTVLIITADHGHLSTPVTAHVYLQNHPRLLEMCSLIPGGEPRHIYLYAQYGAKEELLAYAREHLSDTFVTLDADVALAAGLYGSPKHMHIETPRRLGDVVLIAKGNTCWWDKHNKQVLLGQHGGLEPEEMLVPFVALGPQ